jgi:hypothetical protein
MAQAKTRPSLHGGLGGDEHEEVVRPGDPPGAAVSAIRRPPQLGQKPRRLQLNATSFSA